MTESTEQLVQRMFEELEQINHIHRWNPEEVVKYVAHKMVAFRDDFMQMIFLKCGLKELDAIHALSSLRSMTDQLELRGDGLTFMPRPKQEEYASWLQGQLGKEPEPERVQVSETLHQLESQITDPSEPGFRAVYQDWGELLSLL